MQFINLKAKLKSKQMNNNSTTTQQENIKFFISLLIISSIMLGILHYNFIVLLFSTMLTYMIIDGSNNLLAKLFKNNKDEHRFSTISTLIIVTIVASLISFGSYSLYNYILLSNISSDFSLILNKIISIIENNKLQQFGLPTKITEIKNYIVTFLKSHTSDLTNISKHGLSALIYILIGIIVGAMLIFHVKVHHNNSNKLIEQNDVNSSLYIKQDIIARIKNFKKAFSNVFVAQFKISLIDTILTGIYLYAVLPIFDVNLPFKFTILIIAFIVGLIPVVGNLISNTIIVLMSLSISIKVAISSLIFLVVIHKLEYFLNAKIIGSQINSTAWELLLIMIVFEKIFGIGGIIVAPIYYAYFKQELIDKRIL